MAFTYSDLWAVDAEGTLARMNKGALIGVGLKSEFPAAATGVDGNKHLLAYATDEQKLYYSTGAAWIAVAPGFNTAQTFSGIQTFNSIPVGPASDPTTANQLARKAYVDNKATFGAPWTLVFNGTSPTSWTDLDLSSVVGSNKALVQLQVGPNDTGIKGNVRFRQNGIGNGVADYGSTHFYQNLYSDIAYVVIVTDASGIVEWKCDAAATVSRVYVVAYVK